MQLQVYSCNRVSLSTDFPSKQLFSIHQNCRSFGFGFLGGMNNRSISYSKRSGNDAIVESSLPEGRCSNGREQKSLLAEANSEEQSWLGRSQVSYEEFPSLAASISSKNSKRKCRVDLGINPEEVLKKDDESIDQLLLESYKTLGLPTSFGKKVQSSAHRRSKLSQTHIGLEDQENNALLSEDAGTDDEPFDIFLSRVTKKNAYRSWEAKRNRSKVQSNEEKGDEQFHLLKMNLAPTFFEEMGQVLRPGMVLFKKYIPISEQVGILDRCQTLGLGKGGFYRPGYKDGAKLRLYMMCLGLDWNPQTRKYGEIRELDNVKPPCIPSEFISVVGKILDDSSTLIEKEMKLQSAEDILPPMRPDVCIVNFYTTNGRLGLHQDRDESSESLQKGLPVVSISIGDSAEFLYGHKRDINKAQSLLLESGDVLVFGGESRHIFHGVTNIIPKTAPAELLQNTRLRPGRLNLTFRKY